MIRAALALALGAALGFCGCAPSQGLVKPSRSKPERRMERKVMLNAHQSLELACGSVKIDRPGDIRVERVGDQFHATFTFVTETARRNDYVFHIVVDPVKGEVLKGDDKGQIPAAHGRSAGDQWESFLSARKAYDIAFAALAGFSEYDQQGTLTVELWDDVYLVTFPAPPNPGARGSDYAMQVHVSARTGKVVKLLVAG